MALERLIVQCNHLLLGSRGLTRKRGLWFLVSAIFVLLLSSGLLVCGSGSALPRGIELLAPQLPTATPTSSPTLPFTPTPAATPAPSDTPSPTPMAPLRIQRYGLEVARKNEVLSQTLQELGGLLTSPHFTDQGWKWNVGMHVIAVERIHQELVTMDVPVEMIGVHSALLDAIFDCEEATSFLSNIDNINPSGVRVASRLVASCRQKFPSRAQRFKERYLSPPTNGMPP